MFKHIIAALAAIISPVAITATPPTPFLIDNNVIPKIVCGAWMGTGVYVGNGIVATAHHVIEKGDCTIDGEAVTTVSGSVIQGLDFALLKTPHKQELRTLVDCGGFHEGREYLAIGYALDATMTVVQVLTASDSLSNDPSFAGLTIMRGAVTQGMSGGPVNRIDNGATVGLIIANTEYGITQVLAVPFSRTPLCTNGRVAALVAGGHKKRGGG